jgi:exopolyphosphatase / guanosine-5'-triphosphate,3'-diphosphate pyrophosphatase
VSERSSASQGRHRRTGERGRRPSQGGKAGTQTYAAVDLGTNNCRLLIAEPRDAGFQVVDAFSRIVRLGEGVDSSGVLSDAAIDRTISALRVCAGKMRSARVARTRTVATEACRRASNGQNFLDRVLKETGIELEIIDPGEEASLALAGCTPLIDPDCRHALVFDIGGGSTELIWVEIVAGEDPRVLGWTSLSCGVVTLTERHGGDEISAQTYDDMVRYVSGLLHEFEAKHSIRAAIQNEKSHLLGTSGTVTTLAAVHLELPRYDRSQVDGTWIDVDSLEAVAGNLRGMSFEQRALHPCIRRARADLVVAGCAIMDAITGMWNMPRLRVADRGLREGMLTQMMTADRRAGENRMAGQG